MAAQTIEVVTRKLSDRELVERWLAFAKAVGAPHITVYVANNLPVCNNLPVENPEGNADYPRLKKFMDLGGNLLTAANISVAHHSMRYERSEPFDKVLTTVPGAQQQDLDKTAAIMGEVDKHFEQIDVSASLFGLLDDDLKKYYTQREAELIRLQQLTEQLITRNDEYRQRVDDEQLAREKRLNEEFEQKRKELETSIKERTELLDKREAEMDLADPKSTRRQIRHDLLKKLKPEGGVKLAGQAIGKTWPIHAVFLAGSVALGWVAYHALASEGFDPEKLAHVLRVMLPTAGLIGTVWWYLRWMDAWLRKNVDEELRFRQLEIDVDRASWVVEMLAELEEETKAAIPDGVLEALTRNLFIGPGTTKGVKHPAEDAVAALLGSTREIEVDFPGGRIKTDGRRVRKAVEKATRDDE